jgi:hypothetical protein
VIYTSSFVFDVVGADVSSIESVYTTMYRN